MKARHALFLLLLFIGGCSVREGVLARVGERTASGGFSVRRGLVYAASGGSPLTLDAYIPEGAGPFPGVLVIHGGGWSSRRPRDMRHICRKLARRGFVALNIIYRLAPQDIYPAALEDARAALGWSREHAGELRLDPRRVGAWGYSAGAHLAAMLGTEEGSARAGAVVAGGTPADLTRWPHSPIVTPFLGKTYAEAPELWRRASPVSRVAPASAPFFLYHGTGDTLVEPEQARYLAEALSKVGVPCELYWERGRGHLSAFIFDGGAVEAGVGFLEAALRAKAAPAGR